MSEISKAPRHNYHQLKAGDYVALVYATGADKYKEYQQLVGIVECDSNSCNDLVDVRYKEKVRLKAFNWRFKKVNK